MGKGPTRQVMSESELDEYECCCSCVCEQWCIRNCLSAWVRDSTGTVRVATRCSSEESVFKSIHQSPEQQGDLYADGTRVPPLIRTSILLLLPVMRQMSTSNSSESGSVLETQFWENYRNSGYANRRTQKESL